MSDLGRCLRRQASSRKKLASLMYDAFPTQPSLCQSIKTRQGPWMKELDETTGTILKRFRFDSAVFEKMRAELVRNSPAAESGRLAVSVTSPAIEDLVELAPQASLEGKKLASTT